MSGQDARLLGIQNILLGLQTMTVYKSIYAEAEVAAAVALAPGTARTPSDIDIEAEFELIGIQAEDGQPTEGPEGDGVVPYYALVPIGVTADNIEDTVIADGFRRSRRSAPATPRRPSSARGNAEPNVTEGASTGALPHPGAAPRMADSPFSSAATSRRRSAPSRRSTRSTSRSGPARSWRS